MTVRHAFMNPHQPVTERPLSASEFVQPGTIKRLSDEFDRKREQLRERDFVHLNDRPDLLCRASRALPGTGPASWMNLQVGYDISVVESVKGRVIEGGVPVAVS